MVWTAAGADTLLTNVNIVDIETGAVIEDQSVAIQDDLIGAVGTGLSTPAGAEIVNTAGRFLIPGLWDSHVHIFSTPNEPETALPLYLLHGITGIRDMGALWPLSEQMKLQDRLASGEVLGPRLILSGAWVDASPGSWPGMFLADTPEEARAAVKRISGEGWAAVKSYSMLDPSVYLALADEARTYDIPLVGHIPEQVTLGAAIVAGQNGMEHFGR
ncbi:MAG: hypothetical protein AAF366_22525, partial [Pseudomonadota bacterium]